MKKTILALILVLTSLYHASANASLETARGRPVGIGFVLGDPSGLDFQFKADTDRTWNTGLAWNFDQWLQIWADYAFHFPQFASQVFKDRVDLDSYIGIGAGLVIASSKKYPKSFGFLIRVPLGIEHKLARGPFGFFFELVPALIVGPDTRGDFQFGLGARFYL